LCDDKFSMVLEVWNDIFVFGFVNVSVMAFNSLQEYVNVTHFLQWLWVLHDSLYDEWRIWLGCFLLILILW